MPYRIKSPRDYPNWRPHKGKHSIEYADDQSSRRRRRNVRRRTLFQKSHELAVISGGQVFVLYIDDNDQTWTYASSDHLWEKYTTSGLKQGAEEKRCNEMADVIHVSTEETGQPSQAKLDRTVTIPTPSKKSRFPLSFTSVGDLEDNLLLEQDDGEPVSSLSRSLEDLYREVGLLVPMEQDDNVDLPVVPASLPATRSSEIESTTPSQPAVDHLPIADLSQLVNQPIPVTSLPKAYLNYSATQSTQLASLPTNVGNVPVTKQPHISEMASEINQPLPTSLQVTSLPNSIGQPDTPSSQVVNLLTADIRHSLNTSLKKSSLPSATTTQPIIWSTEVSTLPVDQSLTGTQSPLVASLPPNVDNQTGTKSRCIASPTGNVSPPVAQSTPAGTGCSPKPSKPTIPLTPVTSRNACQTFALSELPSLPSPNVAESTSTGVFPPTQIIAPQDQASQESDQHETTDKENGRADGRNGGKSVSMFYSNRNNKSTAKKALGPLLKSPPKVRKSKRSGKKSAPFRRILQHMKSAGRKVKQ